MNYSTIKWTEVLFRINYFASFSCQLALLNCVITYLSQPVCCCVLKCSGIILPAYSLAYLCMYTYIPTHAVYILYVCVARAWSQVCLCCSSQSVWPVVLAEDLCLPALLSPVLRIVTRVLRLLHFTSFQMKEGVCLGQYCSDAVKTEMAFLVTLNSKTDDGAGSSFCQAGCHGYCCHHQIVKSWSPIRS